MLTINREPNSERSLQYFPTSYFGVRLSQIRVHDLDLHVLQLQAMAIAATAVKIFAAHLLSLGGLNSRSAFSRSLATMTSPRVQCDDPRLSLKPARLQERTEGQRLSHEWNIVGVVTLATGVCLRSMYHSIWSHI